MPRRKPPVITGAVLEGMAAWPARPLEAVYPLIFFDALRVKKRHTEFTDIRLLHPLFRPAPQTA